MSETEPLIHRSEPGVALDPAAEAAACKHVHDFACKEFGWGSDEWADSSAIAGIAIAAYLEALQGETP